MIGRYAVVVPVVASVAMFAACGWDWTVVPKPVVSPEGGTEGGISQDGTCASSADCRATEVCYFDDYRCGAGLRGYCDLAPVEKECSDPAKPKFAACACDGTTVESECAANAKRIDVSADLPCAAPPDTYRCGYNFCPLSTFCYRSGPASSCVEWPCAQRSCEQCKDLIPKCPSATCSTDDAGITTVVCTQ